MSLLAIDVGSAGVTALVVGTDGRVLATGRHPLAAASAQPGWVEHAPEDLWRTALAAVRTVLEQVDAGALHGVGVTGRAGTVVLWDRDTLGSPRPAITTGGGGDPVAALRWVAEHEPHTWALVEAGRYAVGDVASYLVARMTRGLEHLTDPSLAARTGLLDLTTGDWSDELCRRYAVPRDALPEVGSSWGRLATTEARTFLGLSVPITGIAAGEQAALLGQACVDPGAARCALEPDASFLVTAGTTPPPPAGKVRPTIAWRAASGVLTYALRGSVEDLDGPGPLRVDGAAAADDQECQDLADRLEIRVERPRCLDTAALGAAYLAGLGAGTWSAPSDLRGVREVERSFDPGVSRGSRRSRG